MNRLSVITFALFASALVGSAQAPVQVGAGSYASCPPGYKSKTDAHDGFNAHAVEGRALYADEAEGMPLPTNDWWTDLMVNRYSGALWSLPQMLYTGADGVTVNYPTYWYEGNGTEVKSRTSLRVTGRDFTAAEARATAWHDWDVVMTLPGTDESQQMVVTMAHGMPLTWFEIEGFQPEIVFSETPVLSGLGSAHVCATLGDDCYGIYLPDGARAEMVEGRLRISLDSARGSYLVVAVLPSADSVEEFAAYAYSVPRSTTLFWSYDEAASLLRTQWHVDAVNLRSSGSPAPVMQGFLPHAYKYWVSPGMTLDGPSYLSPRGLLRMARGSGDNTFEYSYRFSGMLPYYAAPAADDTRPNPYREEVMADLMARYAASGTFGADTYWGGKGLVQMALNMTFAKETGDEAAYETSRRKLREALVDWLTYTPGEQNRFFAYYPRWGAMVGYDVSYDSDAFNDHHFHYGYFVYAAALLCMEDRRFAEDYGELLTMIVKDYANYERSDARFPFLRTMDPWAGHSYAGGMGDHLNDNGNGQESSSEAMQSWGGVYLLGVALGDRAMRDAGIFGWLTESRATAEYWFDRDHIHPGRQHNYDYDLYKSPWCTNLTSKGIGWWTWFSGDPLWMHSIQWMPVSPILGYLSEDLEFARWDVETMFAGTEYKWFERSGSNDPLADQSVGNVVLCYLERSDPDRAAEIFDRAVEGNNGIYRNIDTGHISYFVIHSHRTYGEIDRDVTASIPTANCYVRPDGARTYMVYNPGAEVCEVTFGRDGSAVRTVKAAPGRLTAFTDEPVASRMTLESSEGTVLPAGTSCALVAEVLDQYEVPFAGQPVSFSVSPASAATVEDGMLRVSAGVSKGTRYTVTARSGSLSASLDFEVNDRPHISEARILPEVTYVEQGMPVTFSLDAVDQYGRPLEGTPQWTVTDVNTGEIRAGSLLDASRPGKYKVAAVLDGRTVTHETVVTPALPNIALGKKAYESSHENEGCLPGNLTDGDHGTRWGSGHTDNEWIYVDLGEPCYVSRISIDWEAAFAADYTIQFSADARSWDDVVSVKGNSSAGIVEHPVSACTPRYVRMRGDRRATQYGYSIHELEIYGFALSQPLDEPVGFDIIAPDWMDEGVAHDLGAVAYTLGGDRSDIDVDWTCSHAAEISGSRITPCEPGHVTITATSRAAVRGAGAMSSSRKVFVNESTKLATLTLTPSSASVLHGESVALSVGGLNQYGGSYPIDTDGVVWTVKDESGHPVETAEVLSGSVFNPSEPGTYTVTAAYGGCAQSATLSALPVSGANLALGRPASATSVRDNNYASYINDGKTDTRWESAWQQDPQSVTIDLESPFYINRMEIAWEGAYARKYNVETSLDGDEWHSVYDHTRSPQDGLTDNFAIEEHPARYVRLNCLQRQLEAYGNSAYEWRVYGTRRYSDITGVTDAACDGVGRRGVYTVCGVRLRDTDDTVGLPAGFYIVGGKKVFINQ